MGEVGILLAELNDEDLQNKSIVDEDVTQFMCRGPCHRLVTNEKFEPYMGLAIVANVVVMSVEHYNQPDKLTMLCSYANLGFTGFFTLEGIVKFLGLGCTEFWKSGWNRFDVFVIIISLGSIYLEMFNTVKLSVNPTLLRILRVFRVARLVRVLNASLGLQSLLMTITRALPAVMNV